MSAWRRKVAIKKALVRSPIEPLFAPPILEHLGRYQLPPVPIVERCLSLFGYELVTACKRNHFEPVSPTGMGHDRNIAF
jgi:hypothetical protein